MNCKACGALTINGELCYPCQMKAVAKRREDLQWQQNPLVRPLPASAAMAKGPKYDNPEAVAWLMERCPNRISPITQHVEMEMPKTGVAFVELIAAAIEHGRSLGPRLEETAQTPEGDHFGMLELDQ